MASSPILRNIKYALRFLPDRPYIRLYYLMRMRKICRLNHPVTYNEKLQYLKLHDRNPLYTTMVDKGAVKPYVVKRIGKEKVIPTIGTWNDPDEIDFASLPDRFVLKCTHDSEGLVLVPDKSMLDIGAAKKKLKKAMARNFYYIGREWPYKNLTPRIIAEPWVEDTKDGELRDYKFFCFDGEPKLMFIALGRAKGKTSFDYFDMDGKHLDIRQHYPNAAVTPHLPEHFEEMKGLARTLSKGIPHVRADFYEADGKVYFGELTFFHFSGFMPFSDPSWDRKLGEYIQLPKGD